MVIILLFVFLFAPQLMRGNIITSNYSEFLNIGYYLPDIVSMFINRITGVDPRSITLWEFALYPIFYISWNWSRLRLGDKFFGDSYSRVSQVKLMERLLTQLKTLSPEGITAFWKVVNSHLKSDGSFDFKSARASMANLPDLYRNKKEEAAANSSPLVEFLILGSALRKLKRLDTKQRRVLLEVRDKMIKQIETP